MVILIYMRLSNVNIQLIFIDKYNSYLVLSMVEVRDAMDLRRSSL
jgi:hypothetical protein